MEFPFSREDFDFLRRIASQRTGIVVSDDKFDMFYARLSRRLRKLGMGRFSDYCELLRSDAGKAELPELVNAITTNLTAFFRENHHFQYLARQLPAPANDGVLRIWSAGCSSGEEAYSIAIALGESPAHAGPDRARILATDIDSQVLRLAASGIYPLEQLSGVSRARLRRWFLKGRGARAGMARVKPELRRMVEFGRLNLVHRWHMERPVHAIFCRNVLIYFDRRTKARLLQRFADSLCDGGHLFVGHSESLLNISDRFEALGNTVYRKRG